MNLGSGAAAELGRTGAKAHSVAPLSGGQVGELVQSHLPGLSGSVVLLDGLDHGAENLQAVNELLSVGEVKVVLLHVLEELNFDYSLSGDEKTHPKTKHKTGPIEVFRTL